MTNGTQSAAASPSLDEAAVDLAAVVTGEAENHLILLPGFNVQVHHALAAPLGKLIEEAEAAGFDLQVASGFRSFARQLSIWNAKALGQRATLDADGQPIDMDRLSDEEKLFAILQWSALPGASRHHWGTDIDVFDASRMPSDYQLQLTIAETEGSGPFTEFHQWLTLHLTRNRNDFYRPYIPGAGGVSPEPWHLSYAPLANIYATQLTEALLREKILVADILLKDAILKNLNDIFNRYLKPYQPTQQEK